MGVDNWTAGNRKLEAKPSVQKALRRLTKDLRVLYGDLMPEVVLYGSQARGDAHGESDVDVLLLFSMPIHASREIRRVSTLLAELNLEHGVLVSIVPVEKDYFDKAEGPFWSSVRREGVYVGAV